jgi:hypothetical protein
MMNAASRSAPKVLLMTSLVASAVLAARGPSDCRCDQGCEEVAVLNFFRQGVSVEIETQIQVNFTLSGG